MSERPFVGKIYFERGDGDSPEEFDRVCTVFGIGGIGETNEIVDATTFCSEGSREYIPGLADGAEPTIETNYVVDDDNIQAMIADVQAKRTSNYRLVVEHSSPPEVYAFTAIAISWELAPSIDDKNTISFGFKITGPVTVPS
jgi:hypothetical protein